MGGVKIKKSNFLKKWVTAQITRKKLEAFIKKYATSVKTLDIGCGGGYYRQYFPNRIGIDIKPGPYVDRICDAHDLSMFADEEFECVLCTEVLEHLHTPQKAIDEMYRVLKRGGTLIITTRFIFPLHDAPADFYRFTRYGLKHLLRNFEILEMKQEASTIETLAVLYQRIGFQCDTLYFKPLRLFWFLTAKLINIFSFMITKEYGEAARQTQTENIMTSGYYVVCKKNL